MRPAAESSPADAACSSWRRSSAATFLRLPVRSHTRRDSCAVARGSFFSHYRWTGFPLRPAAVPAARPVLPARPHPLCAPNFAMLGVSHESLPLFPPPPADPDVTHILRGSLLKPAEEFHCTVAVRAASEPHHARNTPLQRPRPWPAPDGSCPYPLQMDGGKRLVHWLGLPDSHDSWLPETTFVGEDPVPLEPRRPGPWEVRAARHPCTDVA